MTSSLVACRRRGAHHLARPAGAVLHPEGGPCVVAASPVRGGPRKTRVCAAETWVTGPARRRSTPVLVLGLLCAVAAVALGLLVWQRPEREFVDPAVFDAARESVEALYAYDHRDSAASVQGKLDVLTGDLRTQHETDLQSGIVDTYEQVSATTRYEVADVGLQQVDDDQTAAAVVVFGRYVVESVTSGTQAPPQGSGCTVTPEGAQSCTQTVQLRLVDVDGAWKISELTLLTTG